MLAALMVGGVLAGPMAGSVGAQGSAKEPIVLGFLNQEDTPAGTFTQVRQSAEAAVEYVNKELNGVAGRKLVLESCATKASPESSTQCANQLVAKNPVAILGGVDFTAVFSYPVFEKAGIPVLGGASSGPPELNSPNVFKYSGSSVGQAAMAVYAAKNVKAKTAAVIYPDVPGGTYSYQTFMKPAFDNLGVQVTPVPENPATPDWSQAVSRAIADNPDALLVVAPPNACVGVMKAIQTFAYQGSSVIVGTCADPALLDAAGAAAKDIVFISPYLAPDSKAKDARLLKKILKKYAPSDIVTDSFMPQGANAVLNTYALMKKLGPDGITSSALVDAVKATKDQPNFDSYPYSCDASVLPSQISVCDAHMRFLKLGRNGKLVDALPKWVDAAAPLGGS